MPGPWVTTEEVLQDVADILKKDVEKLEMYWLRIADRVLNDGYNDCVSRLLGRGYTMAQLDGWSDRVRYNRDQSLFWLFVRGFLPSNSDDREVDKLDHRKELETALTIMVNGVAVAPGATENDGASVGGGTISEAGYRIKSDTVF
jgi:hypothetical protein